MKIRGEKTPLLLEPPCEVPPSFDSSNIALWGDQIPLAYPPLLYLPAPGEKGNEFSGGSNRRSVIERSFQKSMDFQKL
jgi:hypothetical protein